MYVLFSFYLVFIFIENFVKTRVEGVNHKLGYIKHQRDKPSVR